MLLVAHDREMIGPADRVFEIRTGSLMCTKTKTRILGEPSGAERDAGYVARAMIS
jgi:hypothetical protein